MITLDAIYWPRARVTNQMQRRAQEMRAQGLTYREIADELGIEKTALSRWFRPGGVMAHLTDLEPGHRAKRREQEWDEI